MRYLTLLALAFLMVGCWHHRDQCYYDQWGQYWCDGAFIYVHPEPAQTTTTVVTTSGNNGGGYNNNIIVVEQQPSHCSYDPPFYHDPDYCTFDGDTCCTWQASVYGIEETWCYYDYCGWELVEVYEYYQEYPYEEEANPYRIL